MQNKENYGSISSNSLLKYDTYKLIFRNMIGVFAIKGSMKNLKAAWKQGKKANHKHHRMILGVWSSLILEVKQLQKRQSSKQISPLLWVQSTNSNLLA